MRRCFLALPAALVVFAATTSALATDWPHWRGPALDGVTPDDPWAQAGGVAEPTELWTSDVGIGYSSVVVQDGRLYTAGWVDGRDYVRCLDVATGDELWQFGHEIQKYDQQHQGGSGGTPAVVDGKVVHVFRDGRMVCVDTDGGGLLWERDLPGELGVQLPHFGFAGSPVPDGESVYLDFGKLIKLDVNDGRTIWASEEDYGVSYSSPVPFTAAGRELVAGFPAYGPVVVDAASGDEVGKYRWETEWNMHATTPIIIGERVFISAGSKSGGGLFDVTADGIAPAWETGDMNNGMPTSVPHDGFLYGFDEAQLRCISLEDGTRRWSQRGLGQGTLLVAGDHLVILSEEGELVVARATSEAFEEVFRRDLFEGSDHWVVPVVVGDTVFCRSPAGPLLALKFSPAAPQ